MLHARAGRRLAAAALLVAVAGAAGLSRPVATVAYDTFGESLGLEQRDFRVRNAFDDPTTNDNLVPQPMFPGQLGAPLAIWKAHAEWSSGPWAGTGLGDGVPDKNPVLGSGGANFDNTFQGVTEDAGDLDSNLHGTGPAWPGSLAVTYTPIADGWRIAYNDGAFDWDDGPGAPVAGAWDLQGVATHEIGHSLGLGHSAEIAATMYAVAVDDVGARSLHPDDIAGIQAIYGAASLAKPHITGLGGGFQAGTILEIQGVNFSPVSNEVWFTRIEASGEPLKVGGLPGAGGGTRIDVTIPAGAVNGEVLVKVEGVSGASLSNAFPIDIAFPPVIVQSLDPAAGPLGGFTSVAIHGAGLAAVGEVRFGGQASPELQPQSDALLVAVAPAGAGLGPVDVDVVHVDGIETLPGAFLYVPDPPPGIAAVTPSSGNKLGGTHVTVSGPSVLGVTELRFGGVPATELVIESATTLSAATPPGPAGAVDVLATNLAGSSLLSAGFKYVDQGDAIDVGPGLGGWYGVPVLSGSGDLTPGGGTFELQLSKAFVLAQTRLFVGLGVGSLPLKGGTYYPHPYLMDLVLMTSVTGQATVVGGVPANAPSGVAVVFQAWIADPVAPQDWSASNGLMLVTP